MLIIVSAGLKLSSCTTSYMGGPYQCLKNIIAKYTSGIDGTTKTEKSFDAPPEPGQSKSNVNK